MTPGTLKRLQDTSFAHLLGLVAGTAVRQAHMVFRVPSGFLFCHANLSNSSHWPLGTFLLLPASASSLALASSCWLLPPPGPLFPSSSPPPPLPGIQLFAHGYKKLIAKEHRPGPCSSQVKCIHFYWSLFQTVLPLALALDVSLRCLLSVEIPLEDCSNPASSREAFLTALVHPVPGPL